MDKILIYICPSCDHVESQYILKYGITPYMLYLWRDKQKYTHTQVKFYIFTSEWVYCPPATFALTVVTYEALL